MRHAGRQAKQRTTVAPLMGAGNRDAGPSRDGEAENDVFMRMFGKCSA